MIHYINDDITKTPHEAIIHGVNCQGVMGSGVAKAIRDKWPVVYTDYMNFYNKFDDKRLLLGRFCVTQPDDRFIGNLFTQQFYGRDGQRYANPSAILYSMARFCRDITDLKDLTKIRTIASPKIGCGLGGLDWETEVRPIFEKISLDFNVEFVIYDNGAKPQ